MSSADIGLGGMDALTDTLKTIKTAIDADAAQRKVPTGAIVMWFGLLAAVPTGWTLCDGTQGTPDLRDKFVKGWSAGIEPGGTGGSNTHTHVATEDSQGGHTHDAHTSSVGLGAGTAVLVGPTTHASQGAHTHTLTVPTVDNQPAFKVLAFIMKL